MNRKLALLCACIGLSAASFGCDDDIASQIVKCGTPGELRCENGNQEVCTVTSWTSVTSCPYGCNDLGTTCKLPDVEGAECIITMCKTDQTALNKCSSDYKITEEPCEDGMKCIVDKCQKIEESNVCTEGAKECTDKTHYHVCADNAWGETSECTGDKPVCDKGECVAEAPAEVCKTDQRECTDETHYHVCADNAWGDTEECTGDTPLCNEGVCVAEIPAEVCENDKRECVDGTHYRVCADNAWGDSEECGSDTPICSNGECVAEAPAEVCKTDQRECTDESHYHVCADNAWGDTNECTGDTPNCANGECTAEAAVVCTNDQRVCVDETHFHVCADNAWAATEECSGNTPICSNGECVAGAIKVCEAGQKQCADEKHFQACDVENNQWGKPQACGEGELCNGNGECVPDSAPTGECINGNKECTDDNKALRVCIDEKWVETVCETVGAGYVCDASLSCVSTVVPVCTAGEIKCTSEGSAIIPGKYDVCKADGSGWETNQSCDSKTPYCDSDVSPNACVEGCKSNEHRCSADGVIQICTINHWMDEKKCDDNETCKNGSCVCTAGATKCTQTGKLQTCQNDGTWGKATSCPNNQICDDGVSPAACSDRCTKDTMRCSVDGNAQKCNMQGNWTDVDECSENETCQVNDNKASCVCKDGARQCSNGMQSSVQVCKSGKWETEEKCSQGCDEATTSCNECYIDGMVSCSDKGIFRICKDKKWVDIENCGSKDSCHSDFTKGCCTTKDKDICDGDKDAVLSCGEKTSSVNDTKYYGWVENKCASGSTCTSDNSGAYCGCTNGSKPYCDGQTLYTCKDKKWTGTSCDDNTTCDATAGACVCENGLYACTNNQRKVCKDNKWVNADKECSKSQTCNSDEGGVCVTTQCNESALQDSKFLSEILSTLGLKIDEIGLTCSGNTLLTCKDGKYVVKSTCAEVCTTYSGMMGAINVAYCGKTDSCTVGATRCGDGQILSCRMNKWQIDKTCAKGEVCIENTANGKTSFVCGKEKCENNTYSCNGDKISFCTNNEKSDVADCASSGLTCSEGHCIKK